MTPPKQSPDDWGANEKIVLGSIREFRSDINNLYARMLEVEKTQSKYLGIAIGVGTIAVITSVMNIVMEIAKAGH